MVKCTISIWQHLITVMYHAESRSRANFGVDFFDTNLFISQK